MNSLDYIWWREVNVQYRILVLDTKEWESEVSKKPMMHCLGTNERLNSGTSLDARGRQEG